MAFCIPRNFDGGTIIGGTSEPNNWSTEPAPNVRDRLLRNLAEVNPDILAESGKFTVLRDIVGRRPCRKGGMRLETDNIGGGKGIMHAYGAGGRGYELSWGVADYVASHILSLSKTL